MFKGNAILKIFCVIPYALIVNAFELISEPSEMAPADWMIEMMVSRLTVSGNTLLLFALNNLGYLILFNILFGNHISDWVKSVPAFRFSRIKRRDVWFFGRCAGLIGIAGCYSLIYVGTLLWICQFRTVSGVDREALHVSVVFWLVCTALLIMTTVGINLLSVSYGTARGFLVVYVISVCLVVLALNSGNSRILKTINPLCIFYLFEADSKTQLIRIVYDFIVATGICAVGGVYLQHKDLW